jgi:TRAP-type C4-dicarboxylate transport system permease small subunit
MNFPWPTKLTDRIANVARLIHVISATWVIGLAVIIVVDVVGRYLFGSPLLGTTEIVKNSIVTITFLQIPLAVYRGDMIRTTIVYDRLNANTQRYFRTLMYFTGLIFFLAIAFSSITPAFEAFQVNEYEGEGALRVPTYPVRILIVVNSFFVAYIYATMLIRDWRNPVGDHQ